MKKALLFVLLAAMAACAGNSRSALHDTIVKAITEDNPGCEIVELGWSTRIILPPSVDDEKWLRRTVNIDQDGRTAAYVHIVSCLNGTVNGSRAKGSLLDSEILGSTCSN